MPAEPGPPLLEIENLAVEFAGRNGLARAIDGLSLAIRPREAVALVGESGCGKSVTSLAVMGLLPSPPARFPSGSIRLRKDGKTVDLLRASRRRLRQIRGGDVAMIFQEPMTSLNPVQTIGKQIAEAVLLHQGMSRRAAFARAREMLELVGIAEPARRLQAYPHELSGGMRQRVMIAMALSCRPSLLIADEPTTALDVTIQAQILELMAGLQRDLGMAMLFITHDLGIVAEVADRVMVMYAGRVVESGDARAVLKNPGHPYTAGLLGSVPRIDRLRRHGERLRAIKGMVPDLVQLPAGCSFHPRCAFAEPGLCDTVRPSIEQGPGGRAIGCLRWRDLALEGIA